MIFHFDSGTGEDFDLWTDVNAHLLDDLREIAAGNVSETGIAEYLNGLCEQLAQEEDGHSVETSGGFDPADKALFLQFAEPDTLTPDDRVDYVYRPTYVAATIMMTAFYRFRSFRTPAFTGILRSVLRAAAGREFTGAGYLRIPGLLDTLEIFAEGDTYRFIRKYADVNREFTRKLNEAVTLLNEKICTGEIRNPWLDDDYVERGLEVSEKIRRSLL